MYTPDHKEPLRKLLQMFEIECICCFSNPEISMSKDKDKEDQDNCPPSLAVSFTDIPEGSKLKVRYGKGKNTRNYEAKVF